MEDNKGSIAIYPGTFDPLTNGHVSLVRRGAKVFPQIILAVADETNKKTLFTLEERVEMASRVFAGDLNVHVEPFHGLLVNYVEKRGANVILRGMRAISDFEYEFQLALMNRKLKKSIETVFLMTDFRWLYISSTIIKEAAKLGGNVAGLVPSEVQNRLEKKFAQANGL